MAQEKNVLKSVVTEMHGVLRFLAERLKDGESKKEILLALGLNPAGAGNTPAISEATLDSIKQYTERSEEDINIEAFASVVGDIIQVSNAVHDFVVLATGGDDPSIINDFTDLLIQIYTMEYVRLRTNSTSAKAFYSAFKLINFYEDLSTPSGGIVNFTTSIGLFLKDVIKSFVAKDEAEAKRASDTVFVLLAALSYFVGPVRDNIKIIYGFDPSPGSTSPKGDEITKRVLTFALSYKITDAEGNDVTVVFYISLALKPETQGGGLELKLAGSGKLERKFGKDWKFTIEMEEIPGVDARLKAKIEKEGEKTPWLIGDTTGTRLQFGSASFSLNASIADDDVDFKVNTKDGAFVLAKGKTDSFISSFLPEKGILGNFDFGLGYSFKKGFYVDGGSGISVLVPLHTTFGPLTLNSFFLKGKGNEAGNGLSLETSIGFTTSFLGFTATVERIGLLHDFALPDGEKNLGIVDYSIGFKPPNGIGLSLDAGPFKGGGFLYLDFEKGEYAGALELDFKKIISVKAIGILNTKMPDGSKGFSLLIIITAEFVPIQLSFGFTLNGVGGLLGLNRTVKIDVLREGIRNNAIKSILFPEDIVANMSRIISDIRQIFPPMNDRFLICPMAKLGWGTPSIITLEMGLLLEIPVPRIIILGVLKAMLPEENVALLRLQVNFLGILDFENKYLSFDASLYDSRLLIYTLTGDMALRLSWGDHPVFILTVGGFHPAFKEAPGDLQNMTRLTISLLSGSNPRITLQSYYAVTSNTVQFGAKAELYAAAAGFNIYGFIGYDVLFQFDPFRFIADIYAGLALRRGSSVIMGIRVSGQLSGPKPWDAKGEASFSILFFDITVSFHETWGDRGDKVEPEKADIKQMLTTEINDNRNWKADIPDINNLHVSIKEIKVPAGKVIVHPFGVLSFSQRLVPLDFEIQKFGNKVPKDDKKFVIKTTDPALTTQEVKEQFAPANFTEMKDNEKLSSPSFEQMKSGFKLTGSSALQVPSAVSKSVDYELTYLRKKRLSFAGLYKYARTLFHANTKAGAIAKSNLSHAVNRMSTNAPEPVTLKEEQFAIANTSDMRLHGKDMVAGSYAEAVQLYNELVGSQPALKDQVQILSHYEINQS